MFLSTVFLYIFPVMFFSTVFLYQFLSFVLYFHPSIFLSLRIFFFLSLILPPPFVTQIANLVDKDFKLGHATYPGSSYQYFALK